MADGQPENWSKVTDLSRKTANINPGAIQGLAKQLSDGSTKADNLSAGFKTLHGDLQSAWGEGDDAKAIHEYVLKLSKAGGNVSDKLKTAGTAIQHMGEQLEQIKTKVKNREDQAKHTIQQNNSKLQTHVQKLQSKREAAQRAMDAAHKNGEAHIPKPGESPSDYDDKIQKAKEHTKQANEKEADDAAADIARLLNQADEHIDAAEKALPINISDGYTPIPPPGDPGVTGPSGANGGGADTGGAGTGGLGNTGGSSTGGGADTGGAAVGAGSTSSGGGGGSSTGSGGSSGGSGPSGPPPNTKVSGDVEQWIQEAKKVLEKNGVHLSASDINAIKTIIQHESGGNPHAINNWDSNAAKGTPSKGLMQCIDPTFNSYKLPGHDDIYNPVDNICAGVKYSISRYGSMSNVPGVQGVSSGSGYVGY